MPRVAVMGTTMWGTTLAVMLARRGLEVFLWARTQEEARELSERGRNPRRLPDVAFPPGLAVTSALDEAVAGAELVILAVPTQTVRANARLVAALLGPQTLLVSAAKGLELGTAKRPSEVIAEEVHPAMHRYVCALSGPNLARELAWGLPAATVIAARDLDVARRAQGLIMSPLFRVYTNTDLLGVELGGALKNIIALAAGISDGLGAGDNAKAGVITRGLAEITRLSVAAGARAFTLAGLAGLGDLVATCSSRLSRNRYVGEELGKGRPLQEILASLGQVAEGVPTTLAALELAGRLGVEMPIAEGMRRVLFEGLEPRKAVADLMARDAKSELMGMEP